MRMHILIAALAALPAAAQQTTTWPERDVDRIAVRSGVRANPFTPLERATQVVVPGCRIAEDGPRRVVAVCTTRASALIAREEFGRISQDLWVSNVTDCPHPMGRRAEGTEYRVYVEQGP